MNKTYMLNSVIIILLLCIQHVSANEITNPEFFKNDTIVFSNGSLAKKGLEQANLIGNPIKTGKYIVRLKAQKGYTMLPHSHTDTREITILKGTWCTGYGNTFDKTKLICLKTGDMYTEPANVNHYVYADEETIIQVHGMGPSGRTFVTEKIEFY